MLTDTHAHINEEVFGGANNIIDAMAHDGLAHIICVGCDVKSSVESVKIARSDPRVFAAVGVHPYYPDEVTADSLKMFEELAGDEKTVAIGEIGLDYHRDVYDREGQLRALAEQYSLAREVHLPVIFHVREATGDFCEFLSTRDFPESGVMHCFSGSVETAEICLKKGLYISFGGKLTYRNSTRLAEVAKFVPDDRILIETDAPYLPPAQAMTSPNYPRNVKFVRDKLAELRGVSADDIERITAENAKRLFFKMSEYEKGK